VLDGVKVLDVIDVIDVTSALQEAITTQTEDIIFTDFVKT
jgi:hypothetical protein